MKTASDVWLNKLVQYIKNKFSNMQAALDKKAPAGYGLGEFAKAIHFADLDNTFVCGWYLFSDGSGGIPKYGLVRVESWDQNFGVQTLYTTNGQKRFRYRTSGVWNAWVVENANEGGATTTPAGMVREFNSGAINSATYTTPGASSKFYMVTLKRDNHYFSVTVDWMSIKTAGGTIALNYVFGSGSDFSLGILAATINSDNTVTFNAGLGTIAHVCGYY